MILRRVAAFVVDMLLYFVVAMVLLSTVLSSGMQVHDNVGANFCRTRSSNQCFQMGPTAVVLDDATANGLYYAMTGWWVVIGVVEGVSGAFVGKRLLKIRVVGSSGERPGPLRGAVRGLLMVVDMFFAIGLFLMVITRPNRRIGDFAARTTVVPVGADTGDPIRWDDASQSYLFTDPATGARQRWDADRGEWVADI